MVYWGKKKTSGEITDIESLKTRVESNSNDITEIKADIVEINEKLTTLTNDESALGEQVQTIQGDLNEYVRKNMKLSDLCKEPCEWATDLQDQITSNGRAIDEINKKIGNGTQEKSDLLFSTTKEVTITPSNQSLSGGSYWYDFTYDISNWDNTQYNLEGVMFKNIHKDGVNGYSGEVDPKLRKALISVTFDENNLYGTIYTPNMLETTTGAYKLEITCLWKKVL